MRDPRDIRLHLISIEQIAKDLHRLHQAFSRVGLNEMSVELSGASDSLFGHIVGIERVINDLVGNGEEEQCKVES